MKYVSLLMVVAFLMSSVDCEAQSKRVITKQKAIIEDHIQNDRYDVVESIVDSMLAIYPKSADMMYYKAMCHINRGESEQASDYYTKAIESVNRRSLCSKAFLYYLRGSIDYDLYNYQGAIDDYTTALSVVGKDERLLRDVILQYRAESYYFMCDYSHAQEDLMQIVFANNDGSEVTRALAGLSEISNLLGEYEQTKVFAEELIARNEYLFVANRELAVAYYELGDIHKAIDYAVEMMYVDCFESSEVFVRHIFMCDLEYARNLINKRIEADVEHRYIVEHFAMCDYAMDYTTLLELLPYLKDDISERNYIYAMYEYAHMAGMYDLAVEYLKQYIALDLDAEEALLHRAQLCDYYLEMGEQDLANECAMSAVDMAVDTPLGYGTKGWLYNFMGDADSAAEYYIKALQLDESLTMLRLDLGIVYLEKGDEELANREFERILDLDVKLTGDTARHYALYYLGRKEEAMEWMHRLREANPYDCKLHYECACLFARMGEDSQALDSLSAAFECGYRGLQSIEKDKDFDSIRNSEAFKELLKRYIK